ncbi:hypothetical protein P3102_30935 [Amycolatopsis sp. QT-25]|nr:hypothetical protein [Amycolatopsis sp. QT-25]WET78435.1 hypothetical protein P3102_30935 [Amycolatopsis sp. QT-25]
MKPERDVGKHDVRTVFHTLHSPGSRLADSTLVPCADPAVPTG